LALIAVPSRTDVASYELLKQKIDETIGRINGRFGMPDWAPIMYQYRSLALPELAAWYAASDIALVTPLRDGMNLVAKEYVACRTDSTGVLVLSEMAGAASELGEALIVNPNHVEEIASAIKQALALPAAEQIARNKRMQERLARYDIARFADDFLSHLAEAAKANRAIAQGLLSFPAIASIASRFKDSLERLILLDYDGTLVPFAALPHLASPTEEIISLLRTLALDPHTHVALISGRDQRTLEAWFGHLPLTLVGEHGIRIKEKGRPWRFLARVQTKWKKEVRAVLEVFRDHLPGALIEEKDYALAWHYRLANPDLAELRAGELIAALETQNAAGAYTLVRGHKVIEVRAAGPTKGDAVAELLSQRPHDFVLGAGDDQTDEDIFRALPTGAYSVRVGRGFSAALYRATDYRNIRALLSACIAAAAKMKATESRLIRE
jgi:trehalose 6-phosphate synthase/phosphatase